MEYNSGSTTEESGEPKSQSFHSVLSLFFPNSLYRKEKNVGDEIMLSYFVVTFSVIEYHNKVEQSYKNSIRQRLCRSVYISLKSFVFGCSVRSDSVL